MPTTDPRIVDALRFVAQEARALKLTGSALPRGSRLLEALAALDAAVEKVDADPASWLVAPEAQPELIKTWKVQTTTAGVEITLNRSKVYRLTSGESFAFDVDRAARGWNAPAVDRGSVDRGSAEPPHAPGTVRNLRCCCCDESAGRWAQHWNRDTGYGLCAACARRIRERGGPDATPEAMDRLYGRPGVNYADPDAVPSTEPAECYRE